jgi:hypothetical protein
VKKKGRPSKELKWVQQEKRKQGLPRRGWKVDKKKAKMQGTSLKKSVTEGRNEDCGRRKGDSCKIIRIYIYIYLFIYPKSTPFESCFI